MKRKGLAITTAIALSFTLVSCNNSENTTAAPSASTAETTSESSTPLLSDPFLQKPGDQSVHIGWFSELENAKHAVLTGNIEALSEDEARTAVDGDIAGVNSYPAETMQLSRMFEDADSFVDNAPTESEGIVPRNVFRHEAVVEGIDRIESTPYRVVSIDGDTVAMSEVFHAKDEFGPDEDVTFLLTSDHQQKDNAPANMQYAADILGDIDVALIAGDLINVPDRASEWFDDTRGLAFFQGMQGNAGFKAPNGKTYDGGEILQNAHAYPVIGNHEVMGRIAQQDNLTHVFNNPIPREIAANEYEKVAAEVNPENDPEIKNQWIEDNSFSTTSYEEIFTLPESESGGEKYYATSIGNTRLISLYSTRIWRNETAEPQPEKREEHSRYHDSADSIDKPLERGYGDFLFEDIAVDSEQYNWLKEELSSTETQGAENVIVMLHESPVSNGKNVMPHFGNPEITEETDEEGTTIGYRYDYPAENNVLMTSLLPLIDRENTPVDLVFNGHSHLWNRFQSSNGVNYIETSNVGNSYGFFGPESTWGDNKDGKRNQPPAPWDPENVLPQGNPAGLEAIPPSENPFDSEINPGTAAPFVASNDYSVFSSFDTATGTVSSWIFDATDPNSKPQLLDEFSLS